MNATDVAIFIGYLVTAWALGFAAGYTITQFKRGLDEATRA